MMNPLKCFAHRFQSVILTIKNASKWNQYKWGKWDKQNPEKWNMPSPWSGIKALRVFGHCRFAIEDRCSMRRHRRKAIVIGGGSTCLRKDLGLSPNCLGRAFKLAM